MNHTLTKAAYLHDAALDAKSATLRAIAPLLLLTALVTLLYERIAVKLVKDWYNFPDSSHGLLIPFFAAYLLWDSRRELKAIRMQSSWWGLGPVIAGLFLLLLGVFGADLFFSRISLVLLLAGITWTLLGYPMVARTRFILFVLVLAIPLPTLILNQITFPLQLLASTVASTFLPLVGVPVLRDGNVIHLPAMQLEVAEACSGIRSLMSLFTVAVIYGYFLERGDRYETVRRVILALASVPIAVAANAARIFGTGLCVQYWDPEKAMGFFHEFSGWLMFLLSMGLLFAVHTSMKAAVPLASITRKKT